MSDMGTMVGVEYEGEAGLFHQRLILRTVYPEILQVPPATGLVWLNQMNDPILTTVMPAGRCLERVYGFGAHRRISLSPEVIVRAVLGAQETEDTCREGETLRLPEALPPPTPPDTPPGRGIDEGDFGSW